MAGGSYDTRMKYMLSQGYPSLHFTSKAGELLATAAQSVANTPWGTSGEAFLYGDTQGCPDFREEVAKFLTEEYDDHVNSDRLQVTAGATQGLHLAATIFLRSGDVVFVEDPTYFVAIDLFRKDLGLNVIPVSTDSAGLNMDDLEKKISDHSTKLSGPSDTMFRGMIYCMPSFHNPTGGCLPADRCRRLLELARKHNLLIVNDDVYNILYIGEDSKPRRLLSYEKELYGDQDGNVISNGSFSKILCPGIRVGWMETNKKIIDRIEQSHLAFSGGSFNHYGSLLIAELLKSGVQKQLVKDMRREHLVPRKRPHKAGYPVKMAVLALKEPSNKTLVHRNYTMPKVAIEV